MNSLYIYVTEKSRDPTMNLSCFRMSSIAYYVKQTTTLLRLRGSYIYKTCLTEHRHSTAYADWTLSPIEHFRKRQMFGDGEGIIAL